MNGFCKCMWFVFLHLGVLCSSLTMFTTNKLQQDDQDPNAKQNGLECSPKAYFV